MRITDNMLLANYNTNLQRNISNLAASNMRLASERSFNHVSEDTSAAARAFVIRDQLAKTEEHIRTIDNAAGELSSAEGNIMVIQSLSLIHIYGKDGMFLPISLPDRARLADKTE